MNLLGAEGQLESVGWSLRFDATHWPSGENLTSRTGFLKLKWCSTVERLKLTRTARPSAKAAKKSASA